MQLMLLEQHNKKRIKMAMQGRAKMHGSSTSTGLGPTQLLPAFEVEHKAENDKKPANPEASMNFVQIAQLEQEIQRLRMLQNTLKSTTWLVLHKIDGEGPTYLAEPYWTLNQEPPLCLKGNSPLANEAEYLKHRSDAAFVVYKHYQSGFQSKDVKEAMEEGSTMPDPVPVREVVQPHSEQMIAALDEFVSSHPSFKEKFPGWRSNNPINSPFLFWYCYRSSGVLEGMAEPHKKQMLLLAKWIDGHYSGMHAEVQSKFSAGYVSESTMPFFIQPGEVLVSKNGKGIQGHIAESWPKEDLRTFGSPPEYPNEPQKITQRWSVEVWSYKYDGKFYRSHSTLYINLEFDEDNLDVSIEKLNILPMRFGNDEFRTKLDRRARTMWVCRKRNLIAYKENSENDLAKVSKHLSSYFHNADIR